MFNYQSSLFLSLATAYLDYHIFICLSRLFLFCFRHRSHDSSFRLSHLSMFVNNFFHLFPNPCMPSLTSVSVLLYKNDRCSASRRSISQCLSRSAKPIISPYPGIVNVIFIFLFISGNSCNSNNSNNLLLHFLLLIPSPFSFFPIPQYYFHHPR